MQGKLILVAFAIIAPGLAGCASDDYGSSSSASVGTSFYYGAGYYNYPYYGYGSPVYVVTPPDRPNGPGQGVHPEQPIARPPGASTKPAPSPQPSTSSRMPSAQPRTSSRSAGTSIPRTPRGGGMRRR